MTATTKLGQKATERHDLAGRLVTLAPRPVEAGLKEIDLASQLRKYRSKCEACEAALVQVDCAPMFVDDHVEAVSCHWLQALRTRPDMQHLSVTLSDVWFAMRCLLVCCKDLKYRPFQHVIQLQHLSYRLNVLASNHKSRFLMRQSEEEEREWQQLELDAGAYIVQHYSGGLVALRNELQKSTDCGHSAPKPSESLSKQWLSLQMTIKTDDDAAQVADESLRGSNFRNSLTHCARNFVAKCSVGFAQKHCELSLFQRLPKAEPFKPSEAQLSHLAQWLESRCKATQNDTLAKNFRESLAELSLPAGARVFYNRQKHTDCQRPSAQTLCVQELGADVAHEMQTESMLVEFAQVSASYRTPSSSSSSSTKHKYYDIVLLQLFESYFFSTLRLRFVQNFVVWPGDLLDTEQEQLLATHASDGCQRVQKSPKLLRLNNEWLVLSLGRWWPCVDMSQALLTWLHVVQVEHSCRTDCHASLDSMLSKFLWLQQPLLPVIAASVAQTIALRS